MLWKRFFFYFCTIYIKFILVRSQTTINMVCSYIFTSLLSFPTFILIIKNLSISPSLYHFLLFFSFLPTVYYYNIFNLIYGITIILLSIYTINKLFFLSIFFFSPFLSSFIILSYSDFISILFDI